MGQVTSDGTTPPAEAVVREVLVKAVYRIPAERRLFPDMWADDVAAAVVAALRLPVATGRHCPLDTKDPNE